MKIRDKINAIVNTDYTVFDGSIEIDMIRNNFSEQYIASVLIYDTFGTEKRIILKKDFFGKNVAQIELKINKVLYNLFPEEEVFRIHWSFDKGFSQRLKLVDNLLNYKEYIHKVSDEQLFILY